MLWCLWGRRAVRRAIRLALPVRPRWELEATGRTVARVLAAQVLPVVAVVVAGAILAEDRAAGAWAAAAGVAAGAGASALLAARRARQADLRPRPPAAARAAPGAAPGPPRLPPGAAVPVGRPGGATANPWPAHRPPARAQRAVVELDPANGSARHAVGVRGVPRVPRREPPPDPPRRSS